MSLSVEAGQVFNFLLKHRILRTQKPKAGRFKDNEKELAYLFAYEMPPEERAALEDFLYGLGFQIVVLEGGVYPGIPQAAKFFVLTRVTEGERPSWVSPDVLYRAISVRPNESKTNLQVWAFVIWQCYLTLVYTARGRMPSQVSRYGDEDAPFTRDELVEGIRTFLSDVLKEGSGLDNFFLDILGDEKGQEVDRRVGGFLDVMVQYNRLDHQAREGLYSQTILDALEVAEQYEQGLGHLMPQDAPGAEIFELIAESPKEEAHVPDQQD